MSVYSATYSPDDNKLRLYPTGRLSELDYADARRLGFRWAPKQGLFVAPAWTPEREDWLLELCGEIEDEDRSLVDRAEERAERFDGYAERRGVEAEHAREAVAEVADNIPLGQPILVGHHSERHARRDAERIENGMRKALRLWETSQYWEQRARGAVASARYKERPDVRARRIKRLEADRRAEDRRLEDARAAAEAWSDVGLSLEAALHIANFEGGACAVRLADGSEYWSAWAALRDGKATVDEVRVQRLELSARRIAHAERCLAHLDRRLAYERAMLEAEGGLPAEAVELEVGGRVLVRGEWVTVMRVTRKGGKIVSITTNARYVRRRGIEEVKDYRPPEPGAAEAARAAVKAPPLCNYPDGAKMLTMAEYRRIGGGMRGTMVVDETERWASHRRRSAVERGFRLGPVFISDAKTSYPPAPQDADEPAPEPPSPAGPWGPEEAREAARDREIDGRGEAFDALRAGLRAGVQVVSAPDLFPTPAALADRMAGLLELEPGMRVLEPSAGTGALIEAVVRLGLECRTVLVERDHRLAEHLHGGEIHCADFLAWEDGDGFDRIIANPPFSGGVDVKHIERAMSMLLPGGRMIALCADGPRQREQLMPLASSWESLPAGTFAGTQVRAALLVIMRI